MSAKKKLSVVLTLLVVAVLFAVAAFYAGCDGTGNPVEPPQPTELKASGVYYFDANGNEYLLNINGMSFSLLLGDDYLTGKCTAVEENQVEITFDNEKTATATLSDGAVVLSYDGHEYSFLKRVSYTVEYDVDGGSEVPAQTVLNGKTVAKPSDPSKKGYRFLGWYEDEAFDTAFMFGATPVTANIKLYARFVKEIVGQNEYEVSFVADGEEIANQTTINGKLYQLPTPAAEGQEFVGWWISDFQSADKLTCQYTDQTLTQNTTLYAVWKSDALDISVNADGASWSAKGANVTYTVTIVGPDGNNVFSSPTSQTQQAFNFAANKAGEYAITVSANGQNATTVYYNNKALDRVSLFSVADSSVLVFNAVDNAEKYIISIDCGNKAHNHAEIDNGNSTNYNFANCEMQPGGIKFTVTAIANGYASSVSETFVVDRTLEAVSEIAINEAADEVVWNGVKNATGYVVEITYGDNTDVINVGTENKYSLKDYSGALNIKVYATAKGYNSSEAIETAFNKTKLAAPAGIKVVGSTVSWEAVEGATGYNVMIGGKSASVTAAEYTLTDDMLVAGQTDYAVSVQAVAATAAQNSSYSDAVEFRYGSTMSPIVNYYNGVVTWKYAVNAEYYLVQLDDEAPVRVEAGENSLDGITFKHSGVNTIYVSFVDDKGKESRQVSVEVIAYAVYFDVRGGEPVETQYKAVGDELVLPEATFTGYDFGGWYNVPNGAKGNGLEYGDGVFENANDVAAYAYWTPKKYIVTLMYDNGSGESEEAVVYFGEKFSLSTPENEDTLKVFGGWYRDPNAQGVSYTDASGKGLFNWNDSANVTLHAGWIEIFTFNAIPDGSGYSVSKGPGINLVSTIKVPVSYAKEGEEKKPIVAVNTAEFDKLTNLNVIEIPDTIQQFFITDLSFSGTFYLEAINVYPVEGNHKRIYASVDGVLFYRDEKSDSVELVYSPRRKTGSFVIPDEIVFDARLDENGQVKDAAPLQTINSNVFYNSYLTEIYIPESVTYIGKQAFYLADFVNVVFGAKERAEGEEPAAPLTIESEAFRSCYYLTSVTLPARLQNFKSDVFNYCSALKEIKIDGTGGNYTAKDGVLCNADGTELVFCPAGITGTFTIPRGVTKIGEKAFNGAKFEELIVPGYVTEIGKEAFKSVSALKSITFEAGSELTIRESAFYGCSGLEEVTLPAHLVKLEKYAFGNTTKLTKVSIDGRSDAELENYAFVKNDNKTSYIEEVEIGSHIGMFNISGVFGGSKLATVKVPNGNDNYTDDGDGVLYNNDKTEIAFYPAAKAGEYKTPDSLEILGDNIFQNKTNLTKITITKKVQYIGENAFSGCTGLEEVVFEKGGTDALVIKDSAFYRCLLLTELELPERCTEIGQLAFQYCNALTKITLSRDLEKIGLYEERTAEDGGKVSVLTDVECVFDYCNALATIAVDPASKNFVSIDGILYGKTNDVTDTLLFAPRANKGVNGVVDVPETVTTIFGKAFAYNKNVTEIKFSKGLTNGAKLAVGDKAFYSALALKKATFPAGTESFGQEAFYNCTKLEEIALPAGVKELGASMLQYCSSLTSIALPDGIEALSEGMFTGCNKLKTITIPATVTKLQKNLFSGCTSLEEVKFAPGGEDDLEKNGLIIEDGSTAQGGSNSGPKYTIYYGVFTGCTKLTAVELPARTVYIGKYAFTGCLALGTITIPANVKEIADYAFDQYSNSTYSSSGYTMNKTVPAISGIEFEEGSQLTKIGKYAFRYTLIEKAELPEGLEEIDNFAFNYCTNLTTVSLPSTLKTIGSSAFASANLSKVEIPATVETIGGSAFSGNKNLASVTFLKDAEEATALTSIGDSAFASCAALAKVELPASVKTIGASAFSACSALMEVKFAGDALTSIGNSAFATTAIKTFKFPETAGDLTLGTTLFNNCKQLTEVEFSTKVTAINNMFSGCTALSNVIVAEGNPNYSAGTGEKAGILFNAAGDAVVFIYKTLDGEFVIPDGTVEISANAFQNQSGLTKVTIPASVKQIGEYAFSKCYTLAEVEFSDIATSQLTKIGAYAFEYCQALKKITLPDSVTELGAKIPSTSKNEGYVFSYCTVLEEINLPANLETIYKYAFQYTYALKTITLPGAMKTVGECAFYYSGIQSISIPKGANAKGITFTPGSTFGTFYKSGLKKASLAEGYEAIPNNMFKNCEYLEEISLPSTLKTIGDMAFYYCYELVLRELPASVTSIGSGAFNSCRSIVKMTLPTGLTTVKANAFINCSNLKEVTMPNNVTSMAASMFENCTSLATVNFPSPDTFKTIGASMFKGCTALQSLSLPAGVTTIGNNAFQNCSALQSVTLPDGLTSLGTYVFQNCTALKSISIPKGITKFGTAVSTGQYTFDGCTSLETVELLGDVTIIGAYVFQNCASLSNITLPSTLTILGNYAFNGCAALDSISIPDSVTTIGNYTFKGCTALDSVGFTANSKLTSLGTYAFQNCTSLTSISVPKGITKFGTAVGTSQYTFDGCSSLETVELLGDVTIIGAYVFRNCTSLQSIALPATLTILGNYAFDGCTSLKNVAFERTTDTKTSALATIGGYAFRNCTSLTGISLPKGVTKLGTAINTNGYTFDGCTSLSNVEFQGTVTLIASYSFRNTGFTSFTIPASVTTIGNYAFADCAKLAEITLPNNVTSWGTYVFSNCSALKTVNIPATAKSIGNYAFQSCSALEEITLPDGLTSLGTYAFRYCGSLKSITLPENITEVPDCAFVGCSSLENVVFNGEITAIGSSAFESCVSLVNFEIPATVTLIDEYAFYLTGLKNVSIPASVEEIGYAAFGECNDLVSFSVSSDNGVYYSDANGIIYSSANDALVLFPSGTEGEVTIPTGVEIIDDGAFYSNMKITKVIIPEGVTYIGDDAFGDCDGLVEVVLPKSLETIYDWAFEDCNNLTTINIEEGVTYIGLKAFLNCTSLKQIAIPSTVETLGNYAFSGCTGLETLTLADGVATIGQYAFEKTALTTVTIPGSVAIVSNYAFQNSPALKTIVMQSGVEQIGANAFNGCSALESVTLPDTLTTIGIAFKSTLLKSVTIPGSVKSLSTAFAGLAELETVVLQEGVESIAASAFAGNSKLKNVTLPDSLVAIGEKAFQNCVALESISIPAGVTMFGTSISTGYQFDGCTSLKTVEFKGDFEYLGGYVFRNCTALESVTLPDTVTTIGSYTFQNCTSLKSFTMPNSVTAVGTYLFDGCTALEEATISNSLENINSYMFRNCSSLKSIEIPASVTTLSTNCFTGCLSMSSIFIPKTVVKGSGGYWFSDWTANQTIYVEYKQGAEAAAGWPTFWNLQASGKPVTDARIVYGYTPEA